MKIATAIIITGLFLFLLQTQANNGLMKENPGTVPSTKPGINSPMVPDYTWTGATSTDWDEASNWNPQSVPSATSNVLIPAAATRYPVVITGTLDSIQDLSIESGATLTINPNAGLTVMGTTSLNGTNALIILSNALSTGSFIDNGFGGTGTARVDRYLTGYTTSNDMKYHLISSPVTSQAIQPQFVNLPNITDDFYKFDEPTNTWINTRTSGGTWNSSFETDFVPNRGYLVSYPSNVTKSFSGTLNTVPLDPINITCTYTAPPTGAGGWNLIGNPFPSAIDWDYVTGGGYLSAEMNTALYYYSADDGNYVYYIALPGIPGSYLGTGPEYIPAMQGFLVHVYHAFSQGTVSLDNTVRTHYGNDVFLKRSAASGLPDYLVLSLDGNGFSDKTFVYFTNEATAGFDRTLDAYKLPGINPASPNLYTVSDDQTRMAINSLPPASSAQILPLGFIAGADGSFTISASELTTFVDGVAITLEDLKTGLSQNLMQNPVYSFLGIASDDPNRFLLHFSGPIGISDKQEADPVGIFSCGKAVCLSYPKGQNNGQAVVMDLLGQQLLSKKLNESGTDQVRLNVPEGYYIVRVQTDQAIKTAKVYLR
jgi:hypothetical protein